MPNDKPYVAAACLCDKVVRGDDGVISLTRIIDTFKIIPQPIPADTTPVIEATLFLALKSGDVRGQSEVVLAARNPAGHAAKEAKFPILLNGGEHGANLIVTLLFPATPLGLHWIDVKWGGHLLTSVPLKLAEAAPDQPAAANTPS